MKSSYFVFFIVGWSLFINAIWYFVRLFLRGLPHVKRNVGVKAIKNSNGSHQINKMF